MRTLFALVGLLALAACGPTISCPIGQQPLCQSGSIHGTRCYCVEPGGLNH